MAARISLVMGLVLAVLLSPTAALAHAELDSAIPGPEDVISDVPDALVAHFTQDLDPERSSLQLRDADGEVLVRGGFDDSAPDERTMRMDLPPLEPGTYQVRWTTRSTEDGELERGTYTFTVIAPTPSPPTPSPPPSPTPSPTGAASATPDLPATPPATAAPPSVAPTASADPSPVPAPGSDASQIIIPIAVMLVLSAALLTWLVRRRRA